ncbi:MAG: AAA family ATPase [Saprospiraceae bacterium]|nr:AAA family ATPase [Saprospiraceae bacterium]
MATVESHFKSDVEAVDALAQSYQNLRSEIGKVIVGQDEVVKTVLISLFSNGHSLLVGVPGLAKTLLVSTISEVLDLDFKRIQFTPDLMPSDITGSEILDEDRHFKFNAGPLFANIVLADEINRTPPKTQAALLEAMQERSVTVSGARHLLPQPFFVLATQNPIEQEGTYPLPEAQLDRFMFNIPLTYPSYEEEIRVVKETTSNYDAHLTNILDAKQIMYYQDLVRKIPIADKVLEYAVELANKTRPGSKMAPAIVQDFITWGAGPRASQYLVLGAKCHAAIQGKYSPDIEDIQQIAKYVLRHRIVRNYKAEAEGISEDQIVEKLL